VFAVITAPDYKNENNSLLREEPGMEGERVLSPARDKLIK
jgi:hypothetical protein